MTIVLHQSVGMPTGTGTMIPLSTSFQRAYLSGSLKWKGTGIGLYLALGTAHSLREIWAVGPDMAGNTPSLLNAVLAKFSRSQLLSLLMFSSVAEKKEGLEG